MPCGHTTSPPPKLLISFPESSKRWTGLAFVPRQPGVVPGEHLSVAHTDLPVSIDSHAIGTAPGPPLRTQMCPIPDNAPGVAAAVHGLHFVRLNGAAPLLR